MAVEVLVRHGHTDLVEGWVDAYVRRLDDLPRGAPRITDDSWRDALGDGRRVGDWTTYLDDQLGDAGWREMLAVWWPRQLLRILAGATHGVIRTSHAVRTLLAEAWSEDESSLVVEVPQAVSISRDKPSTPLNAVRLRG